MAGATLADINDQLLSQNQTLDSVDKNISSLSGNLESFLRTMASDKLDKLETQREGDTSTSKAVGAGVTGGIFGGMLDDLLMKLGGPIIAAIAGLGGALIASFTEFGNDLARTFAGIFMIDKFKKGFDGLKRIFSADGRLVKFLDDIGTRLFVMFDDGIKLLRSNILTGGFVMIADELAKLTKFITEPFKGAANLIGTAISDLLKPITNLFGEGSILKTIGNGLQDAFKFISEGPVGKVLGTLGNILKKIFLPIGLIFTAYDVVKGTIEGYEEGGIAGAIGGAIKGLLNSIVAAPLDLLRQGVAWIAEQFGWESGKKFFESFSFDELITNLVDNIKNAFIKMFSDDEAAKRELDSAQNDYEGQLEGFKVGTKGRTGQLFADFGGGTPVVVHGEEAIVPKKSAEGQILSGIEQLMKTGSVTGGFGLGESVAMTPAAQRTIAGFASDKGIQLQAVTQDMNAMMGKQAPIIIQDNSSSNVSSGTTNQGLVMRTTTVDANDPFMQGLRNF